MSDFLTQFKDYVIALGEKHQVDPLLLGSLYLVSKVSMVCFLGWAARRFSLKRPVTLQLLLASISFSIPYLYLLIVGRNLPFWIYIFIALMFIYGAYTIRKKLMTKTTGAGL